MFKKILILSLLCISVLVALNADNTPPQVGRYQISTYGQGGGVYMLDTSTGQLWKATTKGWGGLASWESIIAPLEQPESN